MELHHVCGQNCELKPMSLTRPKMRSVTMWGKLTRRQTYAMVCSCSSQRNDYHETHGEVQNETCYTFSRSIIEMRPIPICCLRLLPGFPWRNKWERFEYFFERSDLPRDNKGRTVESGIRMPYKSVAFFILILGHVNFKLQSISVHQTLLRCDSGQHSTWYNCRIGCFFGAAHYTSEPSQEKAKSLKLHRKQANYKIQEGPCNRQWFVGWKACTV